MGKFDYYWNEDLDKEGITLSDAITKFNLTHEEAVKRLQEAGHCINDDDILTIEQFELLKRMAFPITNLELEQMIHELDFSNSEAEREFCLKYMSTHGNPLIGINMQKVESKADLSKRLTEIAKSPTEHFEFDGAMCYSIAFPNKEIVLTYRCPTCGTVYKYKERGYEHSTYIDSYSIEQGTIDKYVNEIKSLGYDVYVEHLCEKCYLDKYGKDKKGISISLLHFKHIDENSDIINIVSSDDCLLLAEFLKGNNAFRGSYDETVWINKYRKTIERLIGIRARE